MTEVAAAILTTPSVLFLIALMAIWVPDHESVKNKSNPTK